MPIRVVHADGDRGVLEETMPTLETNDMAVTPVVDAEEALDVLAESRVDCLISGTDVGEIDVIDFLGRVRNDYPDTPFVIYTDTWDLRRASTAVTAGVTELVFRDHEPNPSLALVSRVQAAVDRQERRAAREDAAVEERYRRLVESAPAPIVIYDAQGTLVYANEAAASFTNADSPAEIVGSDAMEFVPEEEREWVRDRMMRVLDARETVPQTELEFRALDDETRYAIDVSAPITYRGEPAGQTVLHDVSALKEREQELEEHRRRLATIIDNIPGMIYRCSTVRSPWPMEYVGGQIEELAGYTARQLEEQQVLWGEDVVIDEDAERVDAMVQDAVEREEPFQITYRIETEAGDIKHVWEKGEAIREDGEVVGLEGVIMDVTAQRERQRMLEAHEEHRRELYDVVNDEELVPAERIDAMLEIGTDWLDLELGFVAAVDQERDRQEVVAANGDHDLIRPGAVTSLDRAFCRAVLEADAAVGVNDAVQDDWGDDPAYIEYGLSSYIGSKLYVDGEFYGTLCFAAEDPREDAFSEDDRMFLELLGLGVSYELGMMDEPTDTT